ncbi:MAG TPA: NfeD family protein [Mycobacteriales bacterium]|nr:NfeD family protein [Mycobacteriales bacterium]
MAAWAIWLIAAGLLAIAEMLSLDFMLIMLAGGAGVGAGIAAVGLPAPLQVAVFAVVSIGLIVVVRPIAKRHLLSSTHAGKSPMDHLIGCNAIVTSTVDARQGRVKIGGNEWSAAAYDPAQVLETGETVQVMEIRGATAVVWGEP